MSGVEEALHEIQTGYWELERELVGLHRVATALAGGGRRGSVGSHRGGVPAGRPFAPRAEEFLARLAELTALAATAHARLVAGVSTDYLISSRDEPLGGVASNGHAARCVTPAPPGTF